MELNTLNFSEALQLLKEGKKIKRTSWNDAYLTLYPSYPITGKFFTVLHSPYNTTSEDCQHEGGQLLHFIMLKTEGQSKVWGGGCSDYIPWTPTHSDLLSFDWILVE